MTILIEFDLLFGLFSKNFNVLEGVSLSYLGGGISNKPVLIQLATLRHHEQLLGLGVIHETGLSHDEGLEINV